MLPALLRKVLAESLGYMGAKVKNKSTLSEESKSDITAYLNSCQILISLLFFFLFFLAPLIKNRSNFRGNSG